MPIRRWAGWAAICRECKKPIHLDGDSTVAYPEKDDVVECLAMKENGFKTIEEAITEICGCKRHRK